MHSANNRDSRRRGTALLLIAPMMALCAALSFAPDALADDGSAQDTAPAPADAVQVDAPADTLAGDAAADGTASDVAEDVPAADADAEAGSIDAEIPADPGQASDGGDADGADDSPAAGTADGADGDAAPQQPSAAGNDGTASAEAPAGAGGTLSGQDDAPSIPATMDRPIVSTRDASSASISWAAVDGASAYEVRWSPDGIDWTSAVAGSAGFDALGLDPDRRYLFQVRAIAGQDESVVFGAWSASRAFTTPYLISYSLNGGTQAAGQRGWYRQNSATYVLLSPTRNGYDFAGWYGNESLSGDAIGRILHGSAGNVALYAKWSQRDYTVTYVLNGSDMFAAQNASGNPLTYVTGTGDIALASATRTGYHFAGWYLDEGLTQRIESIPAGSAADLVLYAKWLEREYAIRYVIDSEADSPAANSADNPGTYRTGQEIVLADPRKNYCFFQGWFLDEDCTLRLGRIPVGCTGNIVLYAKWHEGEGDTIDIDSDHQDVVEYASGTVRVDDAVYTIGDGFVSIDMGASADSEALLSIINSLKAGQVLMLMPTQANPSGYCIAFDSLSIVDGIAIVSGSDPSYEQLLDNIELEGIADIGSATFTPADDVIVVASPDMKASATGDLSPFLAQEVELAKLKLELEWKPISGSITIIPGFEYKITGKGDNLYVYVGIFTKLESELSFSLGEDFKKKLGHVSIPLQAPFMSLDYTIYFVGGAEGSATLKISSKATLGFEYKNGETGPVGNFKAGVDDVAECEKGVDVKVGQDGSFSLNFFGEALVDVSLGTGVKAAVTPTLRDTGLICIDVKPRVYAELSFGKYSKIGDLLKLKGTFSFPWLDEQDPITIHIEKKPGSSFRFVDKCTWKGDASSGGGGSWGDDNPAGGGGGGSWGDVVAAGKCGDGVFWSLDESGTLKIWGIGKMEYDLTDCCGPWFEKKDAINSVRISEGVTSIGSDAFHGCTSLASIAIPDSVASIGGWAFSGCTSLASVAIPDSVGSIGHSAFWGCTSLASIAIPDSVASIGGWAFENCTSLASVAIPDSVALIGSYAFSGCTSLASVAIPDSVASIGSYVFENCTSLASIAIPDSVASIGEGVFKYCTSLASVAIPDSVASIRNYAFYGCTSLASVAIPDSVASIGGWAFSGCTSLASIAIPDSVTSIGSYAFSGCTSLVSVAIPDSVTSIGEGVFKYCTSLASVAIPDSVASIGSYAFYGCTSLASVAIPDSVASIGGWAFQNCTSLASVAIPDSVTSIGSYAFENCTSLASISIPSCATVGAGAFDEGTEVIVRPVTALEAQCVATESVGYDFIDDSFSSNESSSAEVVVLEVCTDDSYQNNDSQLESIYLENSQGVELTEASECDEALEKCSSVSCATSGDSVALVFFSDGTEPQLIVEDSNLQQGTDFVVLVATRDDDDRTDDFCSTDSYHPDSVLIA